MIVRRRNHSIRNKSERFAPIQWVTAGSRVKRGEDKAKTLQNIGEYIIEYEC